MTKRGPGRPRVPAHLKRERQIMVTLTDDEWAFLVGIANECGERPSIYVREHALIMARIQSDGVFWPRGNCPNPWHMYAYTMIDPDERAALIPSECPDCGTLAPVIEQTGGSEYRVSLPK